MLSVDWLNVTIASDRAEIVNYLQEVCKERLSIDLQTGGGAHGYVNSLRGLGVVIAWGGDSQRGTLMLSLSGLVASALGWYGLSALIRSIIRRFGVRVRFTRIDLAVDVPGAVWREVDTVNKAVKRLQDGRIQKVTFYQGWRRSQEAISVNDTSSFVQDGHTLYVGSRESERMLRIYDKRKTSGRYTRFEYELKETYAAKVGYMMISGDTLKNAWCLASDRFFDFTGLIPGQSILYEGCVLSVVKSREHKTIDWMYRIAGSISAVHDNYPATFQNVLVEGREKQGLPPCGNTGVHLEEPKYITDISHADLNLKTFGTFRHPHDIGKNWAVLQS